MDFNVETKTYLVFKIPEDKGCVLACVNPSLYSLYTTFLYDGPVLEYNTTINKYIS